MDAAGISGGFGRVAGRALDRRQLVVVRHVADRGVAVDALEAPVHRMGEGLGPDRLDGGIGVVAAGWS